MTTTRLAMLAAVAALAEATKAREAPAAACALHAPPPQSPARPLGRAEDLPDGFMDLWDEDAGARG